MNHIYRTLWSEVFQSWVAAPETAHSSGKSSALIKASSAPSIEKDFGGSSAKSKNGLRSGLPVAMAAYLVCMPFGTFAQSITPVGDVAPLIPNPSPSNWDISDQLLSVGVSSVGSLNIMGGASITANSVNIGQSAGSKGTITLSGLGSEINTQRPVGNNDSSWNVDVGTYGEGVLNVENGGKVLSYRGYIGRFAGSDGTVEIKGNGSEWSTQSYLYVANNGSKGKLTVSDGGVVAAGGVIDIGRNGTAIALVTGSTSKITSARSLNIGNKNGGQGDLTVTDSAQVITQEGYIGRGNGASGVVLIEDGGKWLMSGQLQVGYEGKGALTVGSTAEVGAETITVGNKSGSVGALNIKGNSLVYADTVTIGAESGSDGTLTLNDGILETGQIIKGEGLANLNLNGGILRATKNQTDFFENFDASLKIGSNGLIFDTQSYEVIINSGFSDDAGVNAKFVKEGSGTLILKKASTYKGITEVNRGALKAGAKSVFSESSEYKVAAGATLDLDAFDQTLSSLANSGIVLISSSASTLPSTTLKITGPYVGNNGILVISTVLENDGSASDKLLLSGASAVASGSTAIWVTNAGGLGALTTDVGIPVVVTENGASLQPNSFTLLGEHVDAGAFEYRLYQTAEGAVLRSNAPSSGSDIAYRSEVPLVSALPAQLRQVDMGMLGNYHQRMGDDYLGAEKINSVKKGWVRLIRVNSQISQDGTVSPNSNGNIYGFQAGVSLYQKNKFQAGLYVGQLQGDMHTQGFAGGLMNKEVGYNQLRARYLGAYGTWIDSNGLYVDAVLQASMYRDKLHAEGQNNYSNIKGNAWLASLEVGKPVTLNSKWSFEPQGQIVFHHINMKEKWFDHTSVKINSDNQWVLRLGGRVKGDFNTKLGEFQPYATINFYKASNTKDTSVFKTPAGTTFINSYGGYSSSELALGATLRVNDKSSFYIELGRMWANGGQAKVKSDMKASVGVKFAW